MAIVKRLDKGSALTYAELDGNFDHLTSENTAIRAEFASADENKQSLDATLTAIADESIGAFSHRNKIINGNFGINQRVYVSEAETTEGQYTLDRWRVTTTSGITFSTTNNKTTVTIPIGQTIQQVVEGLNLKSGTYVLSWGGTAQGRIAGGTYGASGSVTASITGGTDTTIEFNAGTVYEVQFEIGSVATSFEHRHYGTELAMCQQYYFTRLWGFTVTKSSALQQWMPVTFPVTMRTAPTSTYSNFTDNDSSGATSAVLAVPTTLGATGFTLEGTITAGSRISVVGSHSAEL
jgi:hypothetical protein